jgi:hypothetical protein
LRIVAPTSLFLLTLCIRATIDTRLQDLVLALELILIFVLKLPHFVGSSVKHWAIACLEGSGLLLRGICGSLRHGESVKEIGNKVRVEWRGGSSGDKKFFNKFWATAGAHASPIVD